MRQARTAIVILIATISKTAGLSSRASESDTRVMDLEFIRVLRTSFPTHILIFNYGKVASTSQQMAFGTLNHSGKLPGVGELSDSYPPGVKIHNSRIARDFIDKLPTGSNVWVITAIRNRFIRDIAAYFQNFRHPEFVEAMGHKTVVELQENYRSRREGYVDDWFQRDFYDATNLDLTTYADQMHTDKYVHVERDLHDKRIHFLAVRFEDIGMWNQIFGRFFTGFALPKSNAVVSEYQDKYIEFINTYTFSEQEISATCHGDTMRFYSASEVSAMAPQCSNNTEKLHGPNYQQPGKHYVSVGNNDLLLYDTGLDLDPDED